MSENTIGNNGAGEKLSIDRRHFLTGAAAAAAIAAMGGLTACGTPASTEETATTSTSGAPSWETVPDAIAESDITETVESDVVVIGAGMAGISTACSAAERGLSVTVIEKNTEWSGRGYGIGVATSKVMRDAGITIDRVQAQKLWMHACGGRANEKLVSLFFNRSGDAMDWAIEKCEGAGVSVLLWDGYSRDPDFPDSAAYHVFLGGPEQTDGRDWSRDVTKLLYEDSVSAGATYVFSTSAAQLEKDGDTVVAVIATDADGNYIRYKGTKGVVLATGDLAGDEEMVDYYAPETKNVAMSVYTPVGVNTGDGHKMGMWAGGAMQDRMLPPMLHPQAYAYQQSAFLSVNTNGERFFNEGTWVQPKALNYMKQPGHIAYTIFDSNWVEDNKASLAHGGGMFWDQFRVMGSPWDEAQGVATVDASIEAGTGWKADTLEDLATQVGVDKDTFLATIERYNELVASGEDIDFAKDPLFLTAIAEPPFYAMQAGAALLTIVGGLKVNENLNVTDAEGTAIPGLYAAGNVSGDLYTIDYPINIPGNSHGRCLTWGYLIGETLANA